MKTMKPLKELYREYKVSTNSAFDISGLENFFRVTLRVPDVSYSHVIEELKYMRRSSDTTTLRQKARQLYRLLHQTIAQEEDIVDDIRHVLNASIN